jgi:outer membrane protein OmpA-like peptidoglycan-associated protein
MCVSACATKGFVRDQVRATEAKVSGQFAAQDTKLQETADRAAASREAADAATHSLQGLDARVGELNTATGDAKTRASDAQTRAERAAEVARDSEARLSQRIADRNKYRLLQTRYIYFDSDRADVRDAGLRELADVATALEADPNALVELQGFADPRGSDRYNQELARERVEVVIRHLVQRGIELRQVRSIAMGKVTLAAGEKPSAEVLADARRVEMRLLTPWSSWEDTQAGMSDRTGSPAASPRFPAPR